MVRYSNVTLKNLIAMAWRLDSRVIIGPAWVDSQLYEITAKLPPASREEQIPTMLQTLLAERFSLAVHLEMREQRVYFLVIGRNGPKLKNAPPVESGELYEARGDRFPVQIFHGGMTGHAVTVTTLAGALAGIAGYQVVAHTRLPGTFDFDLRWTPENSDGNGPDLFTAIQEQLGLKLEPGKASVQMLLIDRVNRSPLN